MPMTNCTVSYPAREGALSDGRCTHRYKGRPYRLERRAKANAKSVKFGEDDRRVSLRSLTHGVVSLALG